MAEDTGHHEQADGGPAAKDHRTRRGLLAGAAGALGVAAAGVVGKAAPALADNGNPVLQGTDNVFPTKRTAVFTPNNSEVGILADPNQSGKGSLGVYGIGQDIGVLGEGAPGGTAGVTGRGGVTGVSGYGGIGVFGSAPDAPFGGGTGVQGAGGGNDPGVRGTGGSGGNGPGVVGFGGEFGGDGVQGNGNGNGNGVTGNGSGTGAGVVGFGGAGGDGVQGNGNGNGNGVTGNGSGTGAGVAGYSTSGWGVFAESASNTALQALGHTGTGVVGTSTGAAGVYGQSGATDGFAITRDGVRGFTDSAKAAGVRGQNASGGHGVSGGTSSTGGGGSAAVDGTNSGTGPGVRGAGGIGVLAQATGSGATALSVQGPAVFSRSGVLTVAAGKSSANVTGVALTSASLVLATLQQHITGVYVQAAVPNVTGSSFTVYLSKAVTAATKVAWFIIN
jgi:hypothetical protein